MPDPIWLNQKERGEYIYQDEEDPNMSPITVIFTAASRFPLAKPVQEMVMPLVGTRPASRNPRAI